MRLLIILFFVLYLTSLKADEIYNLLKIPNLEVYKLNTNNGLKYLNSKKDFIMGFDNNIKCRKTNKTNLNKKFSIIKKNLEKYDSKFLKKINLQFIVLCENLYISEINNNFFSFPTLKLNELMYLISNSDFIIEPHGALTHIASIYNKPVMDLIPKNKINFLSKWKPKSRKSKQVVIDHKDDIFKYTNELMS